MFRLSITIATAFLLAVAARDTLSTLLWSNDPAPSEIAILALQKNPGADGKEGGRLAFRSLIVDGRLARWPSLARRDGWQVEADPEIPGPAIYRSQDAPATMTFHGKRFVAVLSADRWRGTIQVKRNGRTVRMLDVEYTDGRERRIVLEDPAEPASQALLAGALGLLAGCALWFGPIRAARSGLPWLAVYFSVLHLLFWAGQCVGTNKDSPIYVDGGQSLVAGRPDYFPPGYPALLLLTSQVQGDRLGTLVTLLQHAMLVVVALWIYLLARRIMSEDLAFLGAVIAGTLPPMLTISQAVMSEACTCFTLIGAMYFAVRSAETGRTIFAVASGAFIGWAGLLRVIPLIALIPSAALVHWSAQGKKGLRPFAMVAAVSLACLAAPVAWFFHGSGRPSLSNSTGMHLYNRVVNEQKLLDRNAPAAQKLLAALQGKDPAAYAWWNVCLFPAIRELDPEDQERLLRQVALEGIRMDPLRYVGYTPGLAWRMFLAPADWIAAWAETNVVHPEMENPPLVALTASGLTFRLRWEQAHRIFWPVLCWVAIAGVALGLLGRHRGLVLALAWIPAGYLLGSAGVEHFAPRYNAAVVSFVALLAMLPLEFVRTRLHRRADAVEPAASFSMAGTAGDGA